MLIIDNLDIPISIDQDSECWLWEGQRQYGYGFLPVNGRHVWAHRWVFEQVTGRDITGLQIHHNCRKRRCVNPDHCEALTPEEHAARHPTRAHFILKAARIFDEAVLRKLSPPTHCPQGHEFTHENTLQHGGSRRCRICHCERENARFHKKREGMPNRRVPRTFREYQGNKNQRIWPVPAERCRRGHEFTPENTYVVKGGKARQCRTCHRIRIAAARAERKAA